MASSLLFQDPTTLCLTILVAFVVYVAFNMKRKADPTLDDHDRQLRRERNAVAAAARFAQKPTAGTSSHGDVGSPEKGANATTTTAPARSGEPQSLETKTATRAEKKKKVIAAAPKPRDAPAPRLVEDAPEQSQKTLVSETTRETIKTSNEPQRDSNSPREQQTPAKKTNKPAASSRLLQEQTVETSAKKKKKPVSPSKRLELSPLDILCRALSEVMDCNIVLSEPHANQANTSMSRKQSPRKTVVLKNLGDAIENPDDWEFVIQGLDAFLASKENASILLKALKNKTGAPQPYSVTCSAVIRRAVVWHLKCETVARRGLSAVMDTGELPRALQVFENFLASQIATWIRPSVVNRDKSNVATDDDIMDSLFSDDYNPDTATSMPRNTIHKTDPLDQLLDLMEEPNTLVTKMFFKNLFDAYASSSDQETNEDLPTVILKCLLDRLSRTCCYYSSAKRVTTLAEVHFKITALATVINLSPDICQCVAAHVQGEVEQHGRNDKNNCTGLDIEMSSWLRPVLCAGAHVVPEAGMDVPSRQVSTRQTQKLLFLQQLEQVPQFPVSVFGRTHYKDYDQIMQSSQGVMRAAQTLMESIFKKLFVTTEKQVVFDYLLVIAKANDALVDMIKGELLSADGIEAISSRRTFLLGLTSSVAGLATENLMDRFGKVGSEAFDVRYLQMQENSLVSVEERRLVASTASLENAKKVTMTQQKGETQRFSGSTYLFFLLSGLLRVGLFPILRIESELHHRDNKLLTQLQSMASSNHEAASASRLQAYGPCVAAYLGFKTFLDEPEFVRNVTNMSLLQLEWVISIAGGDGLRDRAAANLAMLQYVPEWMCKLPAIWLAHVARRTPRILKPHQAEKAVQYATELLSLGTETDEHGHTRSLFSPIIVTELIRIASAFVAAGVRRATRKQKYRRRRRFGNVSDPESDEEDLRNADVYLSFDQNDLGVTVFTNRLVCTKLCPTLMETFSSLDIVEGLDVDKEFHFDKFGVRSEISELLLRLWCHPNGECKMNLVNQLGRSETVEVVQSFASSVADSLGVNIGFASHRLLDISALYRKKKMSLLDMSVFSQEADSVASLIHMMRRLLLLLCHLSRESSFSATFAGVLNAGTVKAQQSCRSLATMVIHYLDKLTGSDGGTHEDLDLRSGKMSTAVLARRQESMSTEEHQKKRSEVLKARALSVIEFGLDIATISHQLLALAGRWHLESKASLTFLSTIASNDDCDVEHLRNVFNRLVQNHEGPRDDVLYHDGYVDKVTLHEMYSRVKSSPESQGRRRRARQDQMSHSEIDAVASVDDISTFLDDLEHYQATHEKKVHIVPAEEIQKVQHNMLSTESVSNDDDYGSHLSDWTVSSESFLCQPDGFVFSHFYDSAARGRASTGSGKILVKEAKRIHRTLPIPHPNSAAFVCFSEERMDLCRGVITGPVDSPYAHGFFSFDVFYPSGYPQVPPLVTFMTTGGGQTRFNPNLYQDGKVCLSLLGTWHAADESQKWNPRLSSLGQVLLSVQTQLFVEEPYFNEPGYEAKRGTPAGIEAAKKYNLELRLATLRHAIIAQLRDPPKGFEEVSFRHFSLCRQRILVQAKRWTMEAQGTATFGRFERAYSELLALLSSDALKKYDPLPPVSGDVRALEGLDPDLARLCKKGASNPAPSTVNEDKKPSAAVRTAAELSPQEILFASAGREDGHNDVTFNPWATPVNAQQSENVAAPEDRDSDDELYD